MLYFDIKVDLEPHGDRGLVAAGAFDARLSFLVHSSLSFVYSFILVVIYHDYARFSPYLRPTPLREWSVVSS